MLALALLSISLSCTEGKNEGPSQHRQQAKHIILFGTDGLGAYAFKEAAIPSIRKMMDNGSYSLKTRSVLPSSSAVNWASMLMGSGPELHGYTEWGSKTPELPSRKIGKGGIYPSIISLIDEQLPEAKKGVAYTWNGIGYLFEKNMVDLDFNGENDEETVEKALEFLVKHKPVFTFIHVDEPDHAGHAFGHDTPAYYSALKKVDSLVGKVISTLEKEQMMSESVIILSSDHGGVNKGHGGKSLLEVEVPWIVYGKGIRKQRVEQTVVTYDTGATIAYLLGLTPPEFWRGKPITSIVAKSIR